MHATVMSINAVDVFMAIVMATVLCIGKKGGVVAEFVKLLGIFCTIFIALHYYTRFADFLRVQFFGKDTSTEFFAFCLLAISIFMIFVIITRGWALILKVKIYSAIDRWGGLALSLVRGYLICGLIFVALFLAQHKYATPRARQAVSRSIFGNAAVGLYEFSYSVLIEGFFPGEKINEEVFVLMTENLVKGH